MMTFTVWLTRTKRSLTSASNFIKSVFGLPNNISRLSWFGHDDVLS
ncbi:hypothetical protein [Moraxella lacunata]